MDFKLYVLKIRTVLYRWHTYLFIYSIDPSLVFGVGEVFDTCRL